MSALDIIELPWQPGMYGRRVLVDALDRAGRPWCNDVGRLFAAQLDARLEFENGTGSPADDPRRPDTYPLAHVRFVAADITPTSERVASLEAAGLVRPYDYEPWHWQVPNVWAYPLVTSLAVVTGSGSPFPIAHKPKEYPDMRVIKITKDGATTYALIGTRFFQATADVAQANGWAESWGDAREVSQRAWDEALNAAAL